MSLFKNATKKDSQPKKSDKPTVVINDKSLEKKFQDFMELKTKFDSYKAQLDLIKGELTPIGMNLFIELYQDKGIYPESFNVVAGTMQSMFVPTDKYSKLSEEQFTFLTKKYGDDIVEKQTEYVMNTDLVNEYGDQISEAIEKSKKIPDEVKKNLIMIKESLSVAKGTIKMGLSIGKGLNKKKPVSLQEFMGDINPVCYFKEPTVKK